MKFTAGVMAVRCESPFSVWRKKGYINQVVFYRQQGVHTSLIHWCTYQDRQDILERLRIREQQAWVESIEERFWAL